MARDDPFTIDLFGNTALASGFDLGVQGFAADFGPVIEIDPRRSKPAPAAPVRKEPKTTPQIPTKVDFRLRGTRGLAKSGATGRVTTSPPSNWPTKSSVTAFRPDLTSRPS